MTLFKYSMKKAIKYILILFSIVIMLLCGSGNTLLVHAENVDITTTSVRDDLKSMNEDKLSYLSDEEFIFIGMSQYYDKDDNLRTYLYANIPYDISTFDYNWYATISTSVMDENYNITEDFKLYPINYVNHEETWYKLEVLDLPNLEETTRRYYIQDLRVYEEVKLYANVVMPDPGTEGGGGGKPNEDNSSSDTSPDDSTEPSDNYIFCDEVNKVYIFNGITNNQIKVFREEIETITITDKEVVSYCYGDDLDFFGLETGVLSPGNKYNDAFFIFFNTDKKIDTLKEVELTYKQFDFCIGNYGNTCQMEFSFEEDFVNEWLNGDRKGYTGSSYKDDFYINYHEQIVDVIEPGTKKVESSKVDFWGNETYKYETLDNIMDMKKYKAQNDDDFIFTDYASKYSWGVHFLDTTRTFTQKGPNGFAGLITASSVCNTAILRLKFVTDGVVHNAYAVDVPTDDVSGESANTDIPTWFQESFEKILMLIGILILVVILGYLSPIFSVIFNVLIKCITWSFKGILLIISAPFKLIGNLFKPKKRK